MVGHSRSRLKLSLGRAVKLSHLTSHLYFEKVAEWRDRVAGHPRSRLKLSLGRAVKLSHLTSHLYFEKVAERTRLELATPGVTGRYSNQLNYRSALWWV